MKGMSILALAAAVTALLAAPAFAGGAGGVLEGRQYFDPDYANMDLGVRYVGGFGYGVSHHGQRIGGFGMAFSTEPNGDLLTGGVGGVINGQELRVGPFEAAATLWTGVGGVAKHSLLGQPEGWIVLFGQVDVEVGLAVLPFWQLSTYCGMQLLANIAPGQPFEGLLIYTPVVGIRVAWGGFSWW